MTTHIALIGAGNIGTFHLQALMNIEHACVIQVVDPNPQALDKAKAQIASMSENPAVFEVNFLTDMRELAEIIDVAIIATNSDVRCAVMQQLLSTRHVRHLILEKVLFYRHEEYAAAQSVLDRHAVKAWVNCPRRLYEIYQIMASKVRKSESVDITVSGVNWGMSSNSVHFIDLFAYLVGEDNITWDTSGLNPKILQSKRKGYLEVNGALHGVTPNGNQISLRSFNSGTTPMMVDIRTEEFMAIINESNRIAWTANADTWWQFKQEMLHIPVQSQLTNVVVERILDEGMCDLPTYAQSSAQHMPWLQAMQQFIRRHRGEDAAEVAIT